MNCLIRRSRSNDKQTTLTKSTTSSIHRYRYFNHCKFTMRLPNAEFPLAPESPTNSRDPLLSRPFPVVVHPFSSSTPDSCAYERGNPKSPNALVYIGGLTSGPHTANELVGSILTALDDANLGYSIWEFRTRSSYSGWAHSTLDNDARDIASLVAYLRELGKGHIVLMGSSTGKIFLRSQAPDDTNT